MTYDEFLSMEYDAYTKWSLSELIKPMEYDDWVTGSDYLNKLYTSLWGKK